MHRTLRSREYSIRQVYLYTEQTGYKAGDKGVAGATGEESKEDERVESMEGDGSRMTEATRTEMLNRYLFMCDSMEEVIDRILVNDEKGRS